MLNKILILLRLRKRPRVPVHMEPWPRCFYYAVAANIDKAHEGTGWPKPWRD